MKQSLRAASDRLSLRSCFTRVTRLTQSCPPSQFGAQFKMQIYPSSSLPVNDTAAPQPAYCIISARPPPQYRPAGSGLGLFPHCSHIKFMISYWVMRSEPWRQTLIVCWSCYYFFSWGLSDWNDTTDVLSPLGSNNAAHPQTSLQQRRRHQCKGKKL